MSKAHDIPYRTTLPEKEIPNQWLNLRGFMKEKPDPLINPLTFNPVTLSELCDIFSTELAKQELNDTDTYIDIPEKLMDLYRQYRPSPLCRAYHLEKALDTPAKIYYKFEGNNTAGSHKLNSSIPQVYYAKEQGLKGVTTETGAGQWGTALAEACGFFGLDLIVYMVRVSYEGKPFRRNIIETFGGKVIPSPSDTTESGRAILKMDPDSPGSLGTAISEAVETASKDPGFRYTLGSVLNQVALHQSIIGMESYKAMQIYDEYPDIVIGCAGGGSNLAGLIAPFARDKIQGEHNSELLAVEPSSCPTLTRGSYLYDYCDAGKITPMAKMYTLGNEFMPPATHAGGLRYHGMSPIVSKLYHDGYMKAKSYGQTEIFEAAKFFAKYETILPAPESSHAIKGAIDEAIKCREENTKKTILFGLTGTGFFDMKAYDQFNRGEMKDYPLPGDLIEKSLKPLKDLDINK